MPPSLAARLCTCCVAVLVGSNGDPITIQAQGIGLSLIPLADGTTAYLWSGERWLSAPNNNPSCPDECNDETGVCAEPADYIKVVALCPLCFAPGGAVGRHKSRLLLRPRA